MKKIKKLTVLLAAVVISTCIFLGTTGTSVKAVGDETYKDLQIFAKVLNLVQKYYVEKVEVRKLIYGGIKGMLSELDPHTNFLPPDIFKEFQEETSGEFGGLGIEISIQNEVLTIISPIEDTPAWHAGIKSGDKIISINGELTKGLSLVEAAQKMKGKHGVSVKLGIMRKDFKKPKLFKITRGKVKIRSVKYTDMSDGYGYFRITSFIENTHRDFMRKINKLRKKGEVKGLIIDLRNNPGGLLDQAVKMSDAFLEKGTIVSTIGRNAKDKEFVYATKSEDGDLMGFPVMIMVNEFSASASEIFAGALQDNGRALVLGQRSFGKGSVQNVVKLGDGSGLKMTVARYYTPKGKEIQSEGIQPDLIVEEVDTEAFVKAKIAKKVRREKDISGHLKSTLEKEKKSAYRNKKREKLLKEDFQAMQAYNYLRAWKVFKK